MSSTLEYVTIGNGITFTQAVNEVKAKRSVIQTIRIANQKDSLTNIITYIGTKTGHIFGIYLIRRSVIL